MFFVILLTIGCLCRSQSSLPSTTSWLLSNPQWHITSDLLSSRPQQSESKLKSFDNITDSALLTVMGTSDGETIDALEHFFWNMYDGISIEMGALDGTSVTGSQSAIMEEFYWKRILIEANPKFHNNLKYLVNTFAVGAAVCTDARELHYATPHKPEYLMTAGLVEFMDPKFIKQFHPSIYNSGILNGPYNVSIVNWEDIRHEDISIVQCVPMNTILEATRINHFNYFILDVEGAEVSVLQSINFTKYTFDVFVIEKNHQDKIMDFFNSYLEDSYEFVIERGQNVWFKRKSFIPSFRPNVATDCYRGVVKAGIFPSKRGACSSSLKIP
jgi:hypothetical protein